jgi:hypothetical protein
MILNQTTKQHCAACDDTGLVVLAGTYRVGKRIMQPEATSCIWCETGNAKARRFGVMEYGADDIEAPSPDPDLTDPRVRQACKDAFTEFQRAFRAMQAESKARARELREGAHTPQVPVGHKADGSTAPAVPEQHPATTASKSDRPTEAIGAAP